MNISALLSLYEEAQKDYFVANSLLQSARNNITNALSDIINKKYEGATISSKGVILEYALCVVNHNMWVCRDYRDSKATIDILFLAQNLSKGDKKIADKAYNDFAEGEDVKADETIAKEFRYRLPLTTALEGNFSFDF